MSAPKPLFPQPLEIVGVTGEFASGKTLFALTIAPGNRTLMYDTEKSSGTYSAIGFVRVSIPDEMTRIKPTGYKPIDTFTWWWAQVRAITPGQYDVIGIDTISEIEDGLVEWVQKNPTYFGHTSGQYLKMSGVMWGDVKVLWKQVLSDLASRCQTFVFCTHMSNVWQGDRPTGKRKPKGKETLMELASLYLLMERKADAKGQMAAKPAGIVLKSRLVHTSFNAETGELELLPCLPPRLPEATPKAIREYMLKPPDYKRLKRDELVQEEKLSADEREMLSLQKAEADRDAERMRLERLTQQREMMAQQQKDQRAESAKTQAADAKAAAAEGYAKPEMPGMPDEGGPAPVETATPEQLRKILALHDRLIAGGLSEDGWRAKVAAFGVQKARELTTAQAEEFIVRETPTEPAAAPAAETGAESGAGGEAADVAVAA